MTSLAVVQARTSSSRLPAKVLLPVGGLPLVVLAARRAASTGIEVVVATSTDPSDDVLCDVLAAHGVPFLRGPLHDTLARFLSATADLGDSDTVFRLTADNVLPDGALLAAMQARADAEGLDYLLCNGDESGVPYGMSAELVRVGALRRSLEDATTAGDHEHVTPAVARRYGRRYFVPFDAPSGAGLRATVDQLDDYQTVSRLFRGEPDPVTVPARVLAERLHDLPGAAVAPGRTSALVLGTAQLGSEYGIANVLGQPTPEQASEIVRTAIRRGAGWIDTARAYGASEARVGDALTGGWESRARVVTKLSPLVGTDDDDARTVEALVDRSVLESCRDLRTRSLDTVLLHRAVHLDSHGGRVWERLLALREQGWLRRLGVSVQTPAELERALAAPEVEHVQLPFNILDDRWTSALGRLTEARSARHLVVHVRSAFLQGLVLSSDPDAWAAAGLRDAGGVRSWLETTAHETGRDGVADLALAYVRGHAWCDGVVVGVESLAQLESNVDLFRRPALSLDEIARIDGSRPRFEGLRLDPGSWSRP